MNVCDCPPDEQGRHLRVTGRIFPETPHTDHTIGGAGSERKACLACSRCDRGRGWIGSKLVATLFEIDEDRVVAGDPLPVADRQTLVLRPGGRDGDIDVLRQLCAPVEDGEVRLRLDLAHTDNW